MVNVACVCVCVKERERERQKHESTQQVMRCKSGKEEGRAWVVGGGDESEAEWVRADVRAIKQTGRNE